MCLTPYLPMIRRFPESYVVCYVLAAAALVSAFVAGAEMLAAALGLLAVTAVLMFAGTRLEARRSASPRGTYQQMTVAAVALLVPFAYLFVSQYFELQQRERFRSYLEAHNCKFAGFEVTDFSRGGCDRFSNCEEGVEIEEATYQCGIEENLVTFSTFRRMEKSRSHEGGG